MSTTSERAQELRDLADSLEAIGAAEAEHAAALAAYEADKSPENKAAFRAASEALVAARQAVRGENSVRAVAPGDVSITPGTAGKA